MNRYDLLVVGRDDQRVWAVADTDLSRDKAEERVAHFEALTEDHPVVISMARAGTYREGDDFEDLWHEEEE